MVGQNSTGQQQVNTSLYSTRAVIILDGEGRRILSKYYPFLGSSSSSSAMISSLLSKPDLKEQRAFEKKLFEKTRKSSNEIILLDDNVIVYKNNLDLYFYIVGGLDENELILSSLMGSFFDCISTILKGQVDKRSFLEELDAVILALDEFFDNGIVLETNSTTIAQRVQVKRSSGLELGELGSGAAGGLSFNEENLQNTMKQARTLLKNFFN